MENGAEDEAHVRRMLSMEDGPHAMSRSDLMVRAVLFLAVWLVLTGYSLIDLIIGVPAAAIAVWTSRRLLPPGMAEVSAKGMLKQIWRLPAQSLLAGIDVAGQVFALKPKLRPGIIACRTGIPEGMAREAFLMLASLKPGTLPVTEARDGTVRVQAIDLDEDVTAHFDRDEARFMNEVCKTTLQGTRGRE